MEFVLWASRVVHILSAVVLLGGMIYYNAVLRPVADHEKAFAQEWITAVDQRFQGFIWSTVWPLLVTGLLLLVMQPNLAGLSLTDPWTLLIALKAAAFVLLVFFSWQAGVVVSRMRESLPTDADAYEGWRRTYGVLLRRSIVCGLLAILASGALRVV